MNSILRFVLQLLRSQSQNSTRRRAIRDSQFPIECLESRQMLSAHIVSVDQNAPMQSAAIHQNAAAAANFAGQWQLTANGYSGTVDLTQKGNHYQGTVTLNSLPTFHISGTVTGQNGTAPFHFTEFGATISGTITVHRDSPTKFHGTIHAHGAGQSLNIPYTGVKIATA